jgi:ribosomal protein S18 acetylase RimI-like enzyme
MAITITVRKAMLSDALSIGKIYTDGWKMTYRDIVPSSFLAELNPASSAKKFESAILGDAKKRFVYVAEIGKEVVGFVMGGPQKDNPSPEVGQLHDIYLVSEHQGHGVGRELLSACAGQLSAQGFKKMILYVLDENPYQRFYEAAGGILEAYNGSVEIGGQNFKLLKYAWDLKKN